MFKFEFVASGGCRPSFPVLVRLGADTLRKKISGCQRVALGRSYPSGHLLQLVRMFSRSSSRPCDARYFLDRASKALVHGLLVELNARVVFYELVGEVVVGVVCPLLANVTSIGDLAYTREFDIGHV